MAGESAPAIRSRLARTSAKKKPAKQSLNPGVDSHKAARAAIRVDIDASRDALFSAYVAYVSRDGST